MVIKTMLIRNIKSKIVASFACTIFTIKGKGILRENRIRLSLKV